MSKILASHVGSLPRTQDVVDFIFAREREEKYDLAAFDTCMTQAVAETVRKQVEAGIDIVSDGETSKISYATYVKDRYTGFAGDSERNAPADLKLFPKFLERLADDGGTPQYARPMCVGDVKSKGQGELEKDIANAHGAGILGRSALIGQPFEERRELLEVRGGIARAVTVESSVAILDVGGIADL